MVDQVLQNRKTLRTFLLVVVGACLFTACEPEVGSPCSEDPDVMDRVDRQAAGNTLRQDLDFENCSRAFCMSTDGSRPYCTRRCESTLDCGAEGFECTAAIRFGSLGCKDWSAEAECRDSELPFLYCTATGADVIEERDAQYDRDLE